MKSLDKGFQKLQHKQDIDRHTRKHTDRWDRTHYHICICGWWQWCVYCDCW